MDCCVKSGEVEPGVRVTGKNTELVKIISTIANTNDVGHFEIIIYSTTPLSRRCVLNLGVFHCRVFPLQHLRVVEDARVLRRVVCGVNSDRHANCVHFDDGPIVLWQRQTVVSWLASIEELSGTDMLCSDKSGKLTQIIMTVESNLPWCGTSGQGLLSFALLSSEWTQNAKDVFDTMLLKCKQEVQDSLDRHTSLLLVFRSCRRDGRIHSCGLLSQSCGDQGGCGCASVVAC